MCGENFYLFSKQSFFSGSPPRVRGKHSDYNAASETLRITPACAGKTLRAPIPNRGCEDHPRVCGENYPEMTSAVPTPGSPPRVRGKPKQRAAELGRRRITPACAGKTDCDSDAGLYGEDHPRVCGENPTGTKHMGTDMGSPPRVRGKPA